MNWEWSTGTRCAALFPKRGQPATAPWRLVLISVFQFVEGLSDRQAAEAVRGLIDWKYGLGLELADPGFDFPVLIEPSRTQLIFSSRPFVGTAIQSTFSNDATTQTPSGIGGRLLILNMTVANHDFDLYFNTANRAAPLPDGSCFRTSMASCVALGSASPRPISRAGLPKWRANARENAAGLA
jgi:hypothetical protein